MTAQVGNVEGLQLVHTGLVCRDMDMAKPRLTDILNVRWVGDEREDWPLTVYGKPVSINLRIAHASITERPRALTRFTWQGRS